MYGTQLVHAGHRVDVLAHGSRTEQIALNGLRTLDVTTGASDDVRVTVVADGAGGEYELVVISVWSEQIKSVFGSLRALTGSPVLLFLGNNPSGHGVLDGDLRESVHLGFPGIGGTLNGDTVEYMHIPPQPTTLQVGGGTPVVEFVTALTAAGFPISRTPEMDGWLAYHGMFIASICAALYRCDGSAAKLGADRSVLRLMCRAIEEGFQALIHQGLRGAPGNLRTLHRPVLRPFAVWYWARTMRSPMGERCFAGHARHAEPEMRALAADAVERLKDQPRVDNLLLLLAR